MKKDKLPTNVSRSLTARAIGTKQKKAIFLRVYASRLLNVSAACEATGVSRNTVYQWRDKDDTFKKEWDEINEEFYDKLEAVMYAKAITNADNTMLIFLAKTKMKHRGYVERVEQKVSINSFLDVMIAAVDDEE